MTKIDVLSFFEETLAQIGAPTKAARGMTTSASELTWQGASYRARLQSPIPNENLASGEG